MDETAYLRELATRPLGERLRGYSRMTGPGYMQSAMTLGGGSISSCVLMGSLLGYELLWVQPLAILLGVAVLGAIAKQTCQTGERPYKVLWERLHPSLALLWGISALVATVIWHFPQYSLSANGVTTLLAGVGFDEATLSDGARLTLRLAIGGGLLAFAAWVVHLYSAGARALKIYESAVKAMVWGIVIAFAIAAFASGIDWGRLVLGLSGVSFLQRVMAEGLPPAAIVPIVGGLAAAVGINMVFLYPYSLLKKGWGPAHKELAYFDLFSGMLMPFLIATTFVVVATANTVGPEPGQMGGGLRNVLELVPVLATTFGEPIALGLIGFGMVAVGLSSIVMHMVASGFIGSEVFGYDGNSRANLWFAFLPAIGVLGVAYPFPWAMSVTASTLAYPLMPVAVVCFIILLNSKAYMGSERPEGASRVAWNTVLVFAVVFMVGAAWLALRQNWEQLRQAQSVGQPVPSVEPGPIVSPEVAQVLADIRAADTGLLAVSEEDGRFMRLLVVTSGARQALEIGGASGYGAIWLGLGLRETGGRLTTIEYDPVRASEAEVNIRRAGLSDIVQVVTGDAFAEIPRLTGTFDFVFLDAWKEDYRAFLDLTFPRLDPGGLFLAHNVVNKRTEMPGFFEAIDANPALLSSTVMPSGEGMLVAHRRW